MKYQDRDDSVRQEKFSNRNKKKDRPKRFEKGNSKSDYREQSNSHRKSYERDFEK